MLPEMSDELETDRPCPDRWNQCKHITAVYLILGEGFDRDPFLIVRMREHGPRGPVGRGVPTVDAKHRMDAVSTRPAAGKTLRRSWPTQCPRWPAPPSAQQPFPNRPQPSTSTRSNRNRTEGDDHQAGRTHKRSTGHPIRNDILRQSRTATSSTPDQAIRRIAASGRV